MKRPPRMLLTAGIVFGGIVAVAALGTWWILQSTWLREAVRHEIVSEIEASTGGRVELGDFQYDWRALTAEFGLWWFMGPNPANSLPSYESRAGVSRSGSFPW